MRKLHSLSGVVPVGGFMVFHLWTNAKATQGQAPFDAAVRDISHMPFVMLVEFGVILLPLLFHTLYGVWIAINGKPNVLKYTYSRNWMYTLQRVSGLIAAVFIVLHLKDFWWPKMTGAMAPEQFYPKLCEAMSSTTGGVPLYAMWYVFGIAACAFHFANGLWGFCFSWGITVSRRSQRERAGHVQARGQRRGPPAARLQGWSDLRLWQRRAPSTARAARFAASWSSAAGSPG
jgi:succinate dehydrogenase/fumarate reductase cytochrome b subunit (b558 family)